MLPTGVPQVNVTIPVTATRRGYKHTSHDITCHNTPGVETFPQFTKLNYLENCSARSWHEDMCAAGKI